MDDTQFNGISGYPIFTNAMAKILNFTLGKRTLAEFDKKAVTSQNLQN